MTKLQRLIKSALESTTFRGHTMKKISFTKTSAFYECTECCCIVYITTKPAPNGIDIMGDAVAVHCTKDKK